MPSATAMLGAVGDAESDGDASCVPVCVGVGDAVQDADVVARP
jgi:hypothetical protein